MSGAGATNGVSGANGEPDEPAVGDGRWHARAQALRIAFDRGFSEAPAEPVASPALRFLGLRIAGDPFALRMTDVARLHTDGTVVPIPTPSTTLLGIASVRGSLVAVHDLHVVLGYPAGGARRFWALVRRDQPVGLAFDGLDGHFVADSTSSIEAAGGKGRHLRGATRAGVSLRPIIDVASILGALARMTTENTSARER